MTHESDDDQGQDGDQPQEFEGDEEQEEQYDGQGLEQAVGWLRVRLALPPQRSLANSRGHGAAPHSRAMSSMSLARVQESPPQARGAAVWLHV